MERGGETEMYPDSDSSSDSDSEGLDVATGPRPFGCTDGMVSVTEKNCPLPTVAPLYAKLGLHAYNLNRWKKFKLSSFKTYYMSTWSATSLYCATLVAKDSKTSLDQTFEVATSEGSYGYFDLIVDTARPQGTHELFQTFHWNWTVLDDFYKGNLLELSPKYDYSDTSRFYIVKESELKDNDWIRLYLELAAATTDRNNIDSDALSQLEILEVAIETKDYVNPPEERLNKENAIFYIRFRGGRGYPVDHIAVARRSFVTNDSRVCFHLGGNIHVAAQSLPEKTKNPSASKRRPLPVHNRHHSKRNKGALRCSSDPST
ncbi:unnamed protein product [Cochlearia groenlandica]